MFWSQQEVWNYLLCHPVYAAETLQQACRNKLSLLRVTRQSLLHFLPLSDQWSRYQNWSSLLSFSGTFFSTFSYFAIDVLALAQDLPLVMKIRLRDITHFHMFLLYFYYYVTIQHNYSAVWSSLFHHSLNLSDVFSFDKLYVLLTCELR